MNSQLRAAMAEAGSKLPDIANPTTDWRENFKQVVELYRDLASPDLSRQQKRHLMRSIARAEATESRQRARKPRRRR